MFEKVVQTCTKDRNIKSQFLIKFCDVSIKYNLQQKVSICLSKIDKTPLNWSCWSRLVLTSGNLPTAWCYRISSYFCLIKLKDVIVLHVMYVYKMWLHMFSKNTHVYWRQRCYTFTLKFTALLLHVSHIWWFSWYKRISKKISFLYSRE